MPDSAESYAFEDFPRGKVLLRLNFSRRQILSVVVTEYQVQVGQERGGIGRKLSRLGNLPDEQLALFIPKVVPDCKISVMEGYVWGQPQTASQPVKLFPVDSPALPAFNRFNGLTPLGAVGRHLAQEMGWEAARAFAYARGLFLHLVIHGVCLPK